MTVEVYKPVLKKPVSLEPLPEQSVYKAPRRSKAVAPLPPLPPREVIPVYHPIKPNIELIVEIEAMTHPDEPSFAELEAVILAEGL